MRLSPAILLMLLTACGSISFNPTCPPLQEYSGAEQDLAANEMDKAVGEGYIMIPRLVVDYKVLRDQCRVTL